MSRKVRVHLIVALSAIALLLSSSAPVQAAGSQRSKTVVAKERIGKRAEVTSISVGSISAEQAKVVLFVKSKRVERVDQMSITYSCKDPSVSPDQAVTRVKWFSPDEGIDLPAKVGLRLPTKTSSEHCSVTAAVSTPSGGRAGPMTLKLVTFAKK